MESGTDGVEVGLDDGEGADGGAAAGEKGGDEGVVPAGFAEGEVVVPGQA